MLTAHRLLAFLMLVWSAGATLLAVVLALAYLTA